MKTSERMNKKNLKQMFGSKKSKLAKNTNANVYSYKRVQWETFLGFLICLINFDFT